MMDSIVPFVVVLAILAAVALVYVLALRGRLDAGGRRVAVARLESLLASRRELTAYVKARADLSTWRKVTRAWDKTIELEDGSSSPTDRVASFVVAYKSGEILDLFGSRRRLPPGLYFMQTGGGEPFELSEDAVRSGAEFLRVEHVQSESNSARKGNYETRITNVGSVLVRVVRFAGFARSSRTTWKLHTVSGGFYNDRQFREWYGLGDAEWIIPGQTVKDPDNYGGPQVLWAYFGRTADGVEFTAGAVVE